MTSGLDRFVEAQDPVYGQVLTELNAGRKRSHWMWFVFPQLRGLGRSSMAQLYGIADLSEARAFLDHPVLGPRLIECARLVLAVRGHTVQQIFGSPDDLKLRSCMTLFELAAPEELVFGEVLDRYYGGVRDQATLDLVGR
jgi:uncharacterized protein (DUF1810 family)